MAPLRSLANGEFCSDEHQRLFERQKKPAAELAPVRLPGFVSLPHPNARGPMESRPVAAAPRFQVAPSIPAVPFRSQGAMAAGLSLFPLDRPACAAGRGPNGRLQKAKSGSFSRLGPAIPPAPFRHSDAIAAPGLSLLPIYGRPSSPAPGRPVIFPAARPAFAAAPPRIPKPGPRWVLPTPPAPEAATASNWLAMVWRKAPSDLKLLTLVLPVLLIMALSPSMPRLRMASLSPLGASPWGALRQRLANRAGVQYTDDFRSGLDEWQSRANATANWSYDATGFVRPGPLALFRPTLELSDYHFEFLGEIDQKGMGCAFRAADLDNYYAIRIVVSKPGPLPVLKLVRYAVVNGQEDAKEERPLPISARPDMLYRVMIDVRNSDFTIMAQGQVVDFWTDGRLKKGGVGLFCGRGEMARVRWVEVSHQYDALGRLCAYLAPYGAPARNGNWN
jgi:hypothetical protein